jgi:hypothetical protein
MWFLALLILLNALFNNTTFVNSYRLYIAGLPLNIFDGLVVLGVICALLRPRSTVKYVRTTRIHPAMMWMFALFTVAIFGGLIGGASNGASNREIITCLRNFLVAPAALYFGYFLIANVKSSRQFLYIVVAAGLVVSFMIVVFFKSKTETRTFGHLNDARAVAYISTYAGLATALLFYSVSSGMRLLPLLIAWGMMGACLLGQFTTLSRSDWISAAAAMCAAFALLPKQQRLRSAFRAAMAVPVLIASLWVGMYLGTQVSGKNMFNTMHDKILSLLPGETPGVKAKAWDTRLPGMKREVREFLSSPLIGGGFAIDDTAQMEGQYYAGLRHNTWTSTLAETGLLGFSAFALMVGSSIVVGWRMVRARTDQTTVLIGALGVITGCFYIVHGFATMSFNQMRWGLPLFITAGVILRTRQMQLTLMEQAYAEQAMLEQQHEQAMYDPSMDPHDGALDATGQPVFGGNWYQTN